MILGRVVGTLVANRKDEGLLGQKLLVVRNVGVDGEDASGFVVAVDSVGAGEGEMVLYASGSSARQTVA
ncbi:MAG: EutN/CcmL family microcompartment protein, partial [Acidobacteriota bacterium]